jgi:hypothetical protein
MSLVREAQGITEKMQPGVYTAPAQTGGVQGGAQAVQFGRKFDARSRYDDEMNTKMQLMDKNGMTPFGQVYYDDKVGRWLQDKEAAVEAANFDSYFNANFNKNDLASRQWAQQIHPDFYTAREEEMNERAEMVLKLKKIQLRGPQNEEDLKILYLIEQGRVELPSDWDKIGPGYEGTDPSAADIKRNQQQLTRELVRMPLFLTKSQHKNRAEANKGRGAWGNLNRVPAFDGSEPPTVRNNQNVPIAKFSGGRTMGFNFANFLRSPQ